MPALAADLAIQNGERMRPLAATLVFVFATLPIFDAAAYDRRKSRKYDDGDRYEQRYRSSTRTRDGRCTRDNGRPMDSLNLNDRCDREEFWARFNDIGGGNRR
ncbi:MAG: hypothetical protein AB7L90_01295 [Hyphomicrobiaceae bacterium]